MAPSSPRASGELLRERCKQRNKFLELIQEISFERIQLQGPEPGRWAWLLDLLKIIDRVLVLKGNL